jgi:hypothetical protein
MRAIASGIGTALLTLTMPSSLSALAGEMAQARATINSIDAQRYARRLFM